MEIYLDNASTTKPTDKVIEAVVKSLKDMYGNPSSLHKKGVEVEREIKKIRRLISKALGCNEKEIIFTSGGTEANNLAIKGLIKANNRLGNHIITSNIEHKSVLNLYEYLEKDGYSITYLDADREGFVSPEKLKKSVTKETILVSMMHVNNEVGCIQPISEMARIIKEKNSNTRFHVDGIQSFGKINYSVKDLQVDSLSISGHKFHGPKGVGALYVNNSTKIAPLLFGGGQEFNLRSGTENVPGIFGLGEAVKELLNNQEKNITKLKDLKRYLIDLLNNELEDIYLYSPVTDQYAPHIINISLIGIKSEIMLHSLETDGVFVSSGSACSSKGKGYSHVLEAMDIEKKYIDSAIRISLSHMNTKEEIDVAVEKIKVHANNLRRIIRR